MLQEDKDMADQIEAKTKTIGYLPIDKVQTLKGWDEYVDKSSKLSVLRTGAQKAKNSVRERVERTAQRTWRHRFCRRGRQDQSFPGLSQTAASEADEDTGSVLVLSRATVGRNGRSERPPRGRMRG